MATEAKKFEPENPVPPGWTIKEMMEDRNVSQYELMEKLNLSNSDFNLLLIGDLLISTKDAEVLVSTLGLTVSFWNNLENNYRELLEKQRKKRS